MGTLFEGASALYELPAKAGTSILEHLGFGGEDRRDDLLEESSEGGPPPLLRHLLQELWVDNGDRASQQYTGAGSVMTSVLRQGRMTNYHLSLERGWHGIHRAYQASFQDSQRQECIDLLLGLHYTSTHLRRSFTQD